ncbi:MAG: endolytic transglycosylase MltG [Planctomycetes bacterium]|jgi:UPF0755 protein|nr:endolytic transglycosylase MltG [Planctomycetota bacterium]
MLKLLKYGFLVGLLLVFVFAVNLWHGIYRPLQYTGGNTAFILPAGENVKTTAARLESEGLIKSKWYFVFYVWLIDKQSALKAGEYELSPSLSVKSIASLIIEGQTENRERVVKIIEGWTIGDIDKYFTSENLAEEKAFIEAAKRPAISWASAYSPASGNNFLSELPPSAGLEGFLFPDTYRVFHDAGPDKIIFKMLENFDKKLTAAVRQEIVRQNKKLYDIIILASIVEKEVAMAGDRKTVAGIFWKRLDAGMPLQADSTVNYLTGKNTPAISLNDREIDSPYNTYKYPGLPPGPICNPGLDAIMAAVYPGTSEYWYFLNRSDNGATVFSRTYEEHLSNKAKYLK